MPIPLPPETVILEAAVAQIRAMDLANLFGLPQVTVRHRRHRNANNSEMPGVALSYTLTEIDNERGAFHTSSEQCWAMDVDIVIDLELLPEKDGAGPAGDDNDATGWDRLLGMGHYIAGQLIRYDSPMRNLIDDLLHGDVKPDEDSQPDKGRLARAVTMLYRTTFDDPLQLLSPEENA